MDICEIIPKGPQMSDVEELQQSHELVIPALCHGRTRFIAFSMDRFIKCSDIERALSMLMLKINDIQSTAFLLRFFVKDLNERWDPLMRRGDTETVQISLTRALISYLTFGNATMLLPNDHASYAVHCGLGFVNSAEDRTLTVTLFVILGHHILTSSQHSNVGYTLEYIVAAALVANNSGVQSNQRRLSVWNNMIESYLLQDYDFDSSAGFSRIKCQGQTLSTAALALRYCTQFKLNL
ncbi:hypothetical protein MP228_002767 [Amoeboaphelidium protococcarum]|nr:hypothetical protein MP228_002767 [Amoeboaphelidium protococcarum]